jgi:hypothetical protein
MIQWLLCRLGLHQRRYRESIWTDPGKPAYWDMGIVPAGDFVSRWRAESWCASCGYTLEVSDTTYERNGTYYPTVGA